MKVNRFQSFSIVMSLILLMTILIADHLFAKTYVYDGGEKSYVVKGQGEKVFRRAKNEQEAIQFSTSWRDRANQYIQQGNYAEAVKSATMAINYRPTDNNNFMVRAKAYEGLGDYSKASKDYARIIKRNPESAPAYNALGELFEKVGNYADAKKYYKTGCGYNSNTACTNLERLNQGAAGNPQEEFKHAETAEDFERFIESYKPAELAYVAVQRLARPYLQVKDWQGAAAVFQKYQQDFPDKQQDIAKIIAILIAPEEGLDFRNIGSQVNTELGEYNPVISADGMKLYFGRDRGNTIGGEEIFVSEMNDDEWGRAVSIGPPVNTESHEVPLSISADGNTIALFGNYPESFGRGDIFYVDKTSTCWTNIMHYPAPINSPHFESNAMYTADGKSILFVSERPGGVGEYRKKDEFFHGSYGGNTDIYVYTQNENGNFEAINLGDTINTPFSEYSPFLHPDGKTLYFSSDGHYGLGGLDVFMSYRLSDTSWTEWSEPVNLGKEINGPHNDWGYQIATSGEWAYFSVADRLEGFGANDIYMAQLPQNARPQPVTTLSGKVTDPNGNIVENVQIRWNDVAQQKEVGQAKSDPQTGTYFIALPAGRLYGYFAEKEGYMGRSEEVDLRDKATFAQYTVDIMMYPVEQIREEMLSIRLNNVFFDFDQWSLKPESHMELDRWVVFLNNHPDITAQIHGHTDNIGPDAYNQELSNKRAGSVVNYLTAKGIDKNRLVAKGFGESRPVADNTDSDGRRLNRRVEIQFNGKSGMIMPSGSSSESTSASPITSTVTDTESALDYEELTAEPGEEQPEAEGAGIMEDQQN